MDRLLMSKNGPAVAGLVLGVIAAFLVKFGNPGNMGFCVACFTRDIAGAFGLHRAAIVQYLRPEIAGFILGAFGSALAFSEYRPRGGSSPMVRFALGFFAMIGALVFLGCPWRAYLRLAGGDFNAIAGIAGLIVGIGIGVWFLYGGFSLGPSRPTPKAAGLVMPLFAAAILILLFVRPLLGPKGTGPIFFSESGPGISLKKPGYGLIILCPGSGSLPGICHVRFIPAISHLIAGHILRGIRILIRLRRFLLIGLCRLSPLLQDGFQLFCSRKGRKGPGSEHKSAEKRQQELLYHCTGAGPSPGYPFFYEVFILSSHKLRCPL